MIAAIVLVVEFSAATAWTLCGVAVAVGIAAELFLKRRTPLILSLFALAALMLTRAALPAQSAVAYDVRYDVIAVATTEQSGARKWSRARIDVLATRDSATDWRETRFSAFVNVDTSKHLAFKRGDTLALRGFFRRINGSYGERLAKQGLEGQFYTYNASVVGASDTSFFDRINAARHRAAARIDMIDTASPIAAATLTAITIGLRAEMPKETIVDYRRAGVAHLLAISGLHIGIVVALLNLLLMSIRPWSRTTRYTYSILIILMLWGYALFSGMSPSVLRAVIMFTLYQVATMIYRDGTSLNVLSAAAIVLLLVDPLYLYDIGFQLSFTAMAGIATLYRPLSAMWRIENRALRGVWQAVVVALSAQIAVLPLSIYYFEYLPYLGLPVGLLLWAFIPVMIGGTLLFLLTSWSWIGQVAIWTAELQNSLLAIVSDNEWIVADGLTLPLWGLCLIYSAMICAAVYLNYVSNKKLRRTIIRSTYNF